VKKSVKIGKQTYSKKITSMQVFLQYKAQPRIIALMAVWNSRDQSSKIGLVLGEKLVYV
jgi:hypothetical protein